MLDIVGLLQTEKDAFTRSERALTEIVLADVDSVLKMSIVDLAAQAEVSPPTVARPPLRPSDRMSSGGQPSLRM